MSDPHISEVRALIKAIYRNGHFDGRWFEKGDDRNTGKFEVWEEEFNKVLFHHTQAVLDCEQCKEAHKHHEA